MDTITLFKKSAEMFYQSMDKNNNHNHRYLSWEHCYLSFYKARNKDLKDSDYDSLSLHLAFYLASWGMYRGSSFLLHKDYRVHIPIVKEILKPKYDDLLELECIDLEKESIQSLLKELEDSLESSYNAIRESVSKHQVKKGISTVLITKVLLGTLGCVPAYDRFFMYGIKDQNVSTGNYNLNSLLKLAAFYKKHSKELEKLRERFKLEKEKEDKKVGEKDLIYPQMKLIDMGFWQIGFDNQVKTSSTNSK